MNRENIPFGSSLTGIRDYRTGNWNDVAFSGLIEKSKYLIDTRGYPAWTL
ncbi:hypothetical protein [Methanospirillum hungatei]|nr:hypothetical protein [Methanospirillum hungatei]